MNAIGNARVTEPRATSAGRGRRRWPLRFAGTAIGLVLLCVLGGLWLHTKLAVDPLADLLVAEATLGDVEQAVEATGSVRPTQFVAVGAQVSGRITKMNATIGKRFATGDLIAEIDSVPQQNDLKTAEAALDDVRAQKRQKEAALAYAESALAREQTTLAKEASSRDAWESAKATVETTRAQIEFPRRANPGSGSQGRQRPRSARLYAHHRADRRDGAAGGRARRPKRQRRPVGPDDHRARPDRPDAGAGRNLRSRRAES